MAKTAVATKENTALPAFMQEQVGLGTEALGSADVEVPRVKLMQVLSPELEEYNELKAGDFFHTLAEESLGKSTRISPIYIDKSYILWRPRDAGGGILARALDGVHWSPARAEFETTLKGGVKVTWRTAPTVAESRLGEWGTYNPADPNSPPAATQMFNIVVTFPDQPDMPPAVVTLQRASIRVARRFTGKLKITRAPSFGLIFAMSSVKDRNNAGQEFYNFAFKGDGMIQDKGFYDRNYEFYRYFKEQGVKVKDIEGVQDDEIPHDGGNSGGNGSTTGDGKGPAF